MQLHGKVACSIPQIYCLHIYMLNSPTQSTSDNFQWNPFPATTCRIHLWGILLTYTFDISLLITYNKIHTPINCLSGNQIQPLIPGSWGHRYTKQQYRQHLTRSYHGAWRTTRGTHQNPRAITSIGPLFHLCCDTATDEELHVLTTSEDAVTTPIWTMYNRSCRPREHCGNVWSLHLQRLHSTHKGHDTLEVFQYIIKKSQNISVTNIYKTIAAYKLQQKRIVYYNSLMSFLSTIPSNCREHLSTHTTVPPYTLYTNLKLLEAKETPLIIPPKNIQFYYHLPLTQCLITTQFVKHNTKRVPVYCITFHGRFYEYVSIPLRWESKCVHCHRTTS